jgi:pantoate--beta-alanine ligase
VPALSDILCGEVRPGHFRGVATIVCKLFNLVQPDVSVFGEKDWQQFVILSRMAEGLCFPIEIHGAPTKREADGLAMSSRNRYLEPAERAVAPALYQSLRQAAAGLRAGVTDFEALQREGWGALEAAGFSPDYFEIRDAYGLGAPSPDGSWVVMAAAWLGKARLIDNLRVASSRD